MFPQEEGDITFLDVEFTAGAVLQLFPGANMMGNSVGNVLKIVGKRKGNSGSGVVHKGEEGVILGGGVGWITKNQGGTQILVGVEDAQRHRGATGG